MITYTYSRFPLNTSLLHEEMVQSLGEDRFFSISTHPQQGVIFQVADDVTRDELDLVIASHIPTEKTERQRQQEEAVERLDWFTERFDPAKLRADINRDGVTPAVALAIVEALEALVKISRV